MTVTAPSPPDAIATRTVKRTTPTPSLKRLSPAIFASSVSGTLTCFRMPVTATGSVGEISAPKTRQYENGITRPNALKLTCINPATTSVDMTIPTVASVMITHRRLINASRSTWSAPAKRRKLSSAFINVSPKSMLVTMPRTVVPRASAGTAASATSTTTDTASAIMTRPMVCGSRNQR